MPKSSKESPSKKRKDETSGLLIPAGLFIGIGIGFLLDELVAYTLLGLGAGFLAMCLVRMVGKK